MHRHALKRGADMLANKATVPRQHLDIPIEVDMGVWHLAPPFRGKDECRSDPAVDIDPAVGFGRAGQIGQLIKLVFSRREVLRQRLQHAGAVMECHRAKRRAARRQRMVVHRRHVGRTGTGITDHRAGECVVKRHGIIGGRCPLSSYKGMNLEEAHGTSILNGCEYIIDRPVGNVK